MTEQVPRRSQLCKIWAVRAGLFGMDLAPISIWRTTRSLRRGVRGIKHPTGRERPRSVLRVLLGPPKSAVSDWQPTAAESYMTRRSSALLTGRRNLGRQGVGVTAALRLSGDSDIGGVAMRSACDRPPPSQTNLWRF